MHVRFLGGAREVGRIGIAVKTETTQILLDYGVMLNHKPGFPMHIAPKEVNAIILTHSHLDHSGAIPIFYLDGKKLLYTNKLNLELTHLLISDFIRLSSYYLPFEYLELKTMARSNKPLDFGIEEKIGDIKFQLLNAGHTPGSAQVLVEAEGKQILYTSDFNTADTELLEGAKMEYDNLDAVIMESTYANEAHTERSKLEKRFVEEVTDIVEKGGVVLVPAFGVGRSQEILCVLAAHHFEYPVVIDGMAREVSRIMMNHKEFLRDSKLFLDAANSADWVEGWRDRRRAVKKASVIISPAGMLKGGPAVFYASKIGKKAKNAIFLVSYQIPGTPGRELIEKGSCNIDGNICKVKARVENFDFSSHCGATQLKEVVKKLGEKPKIYVVHGAEENCESFAKWIKNDSGLEAAAPKNGDIVEI